MQINVLRTTIYTLKPMSRHENDCKLQLGPKLKPDSDSNAFKTSQISLSKSEKSTNPMHQYERDIFLLHGIARSDVTMDLQCVRMVHHLAASQLRQYLKSHSHLELNHRVPHVLQSIKSTAHQRGYPPQARAGPCASPASSSAAAAPPLTRTAR